MNHTLQYPLKLGDWSVTMRMDPPDDIRHLWSGMGHNHAEYELHVLLEGSCSVDIDGRSHLLTSGHAIIIAPGTYHCPMPDMGAFERFSVCFSVEGGPLPEALRTEVPTFRLYPVTEEVSGICRDIFYEFSEPRIFGDDMLSAHLLRLLVCNLRLLHIPVEPQAIRGRPAVMVKGDCTDLIDVFFETHLKENCTVEQLAEQLYISGRQLTRLLQKHYGMSFREKLTATRLNRAAWLLRHTDMTVTAVATEVGYSVPSSFYHVFRQRFGMTPEQYRAAKKEAKEKSP